MQSPPLEWALGIAHLGVIDILRDRGEPDGDTLTECIRVLFRVHDPRGRAALAGFLVLSGIGTYRHLTKPEMRGA